MRKRTYLITCAFLACQILLYFLLLRFAEPNVNVTIRTQGIMLALNMSSLGPRTAHFTTVVSIFFAFNASKHWLGGYDVWSRQMLASVHSPLVMFVDRVSYEHFHELRELQTKEQPTLATTFIVYDTIWQMLSELEAERNKSYVHNYRHVQYTLDAEKQHVPELYAVWNLKAHFVNRVASLNPYHSEFFVYTDAGAWRDGIVPGWPDDAFTRKVAARVGHDRMLLGQLKWRMRHAPVEDFVQGTFFAGSAPALAAFERAFYAVHDSRMDQGHFIGKDQTIMNIVFFGLRKSYKATVNATRIKLWKPSCGNRWFFYQRFFAPPEHYKCRIADRMSLLTGPKNI